MINSKDNPISKHIQKLQTKPKFRKETRHYLVESQHHIQDILESTPEYIQFVIYTTLPKQLKDNFLTKNIPLLEISDSLLKKCVSIKQSSGFLAVVYHPKPTHLPLKTSAFYLDRISNPKNLGAIIRNSAAFGFNTLFLSPESVDPFHPEAVRASAGTLSKINIINSNLDSILKLNPTIYPILLDTHSNRSIKDIPLQTQILFILGSEKGFTDSKIETNTLPSYKIDLQNNLDSLNVAVTTGILGFYLSTR